MRYSAVGIVLLAGFFLSTALCASEAHLNLFTLVLGTYLLLSAQTRPRGGLILAGFVLGLAILARLDNVFVVATIIGSALLLAERRDLRTLIRRGASVGGPILLVVGSYLLYNFLTFGHMMPISGAIKSTFPEVVGKIDNLSTLGKLASVFAVASVLLSFVRWRQPLLRVALVGLGTGVLLHSGYIVLFTDHYTFWSWYYVSGVLNAALLAVLAADRGQAWSSDPRWRRIVGAAVYAAVLFLVVCGLGYAWAKALNPQRIGPLVLTSRPAACRWPEQLGSWMKSNLPEGGGFWCTTGPAHSLTIRL